MPGPVHSSGRVVTCGVTVGRADHCGRRGGPGSGGVLPPLVGQMAPAAGEVVRSVSVVVRVWSWYCRTRLAHVRPGACGGVDHGLWAMLVLSVVCGRSAMIAVVGRLCVMVVFGDCHAGSNGHGTSTDLVMRAGDRGSGSAWTGRTFLVRHQLAKFLTHLLRPDLGDDTVNLRPSPLADHLILTELRKWVPIPRPRARQTAVCCRSCPLTRAHGPREIDGDPVAWSGGAARPRRRGRHRSSNPALRARRPGRRPRAGRGYRGTHPPGLGR